MPVIISGDGNDSLWRLFSCSARSPMFSSRIMSAIPPPTSKCLSLYYYCYSICNIDACPFPYYSEPLIQFSLPPNELFLFFLLQQNAWKICYTFLQFSLKHLLTDFHHHKYTKFSNRFSPSQVYQIFSSQTRSNDQILIFILMILIEVSDKHTYFIWL